ncbi:MAG: alpha/beta fold hydrolase [Alphaproteobacteria bacterium]|nr:alpha/beta fold hydrolase [Alphaproteobacteria bacterium]
MQNEKQESIFDAIDTKFQAQLSVLTNGTSPVARQDDLFAWINHLSLAPGKLLELALYPLAHGHEIMQRMGDEKGPGGGKDARFRSENWKKWPWRLYAENFITTEAWWHTATSNVPGLGDQVERAVSFAGRQVIDAMSPVNFPLTNPDVVEETVRTGGANCIKGMMNAMEDMRRTMSGEPPTESEGFKVGENLAITPGKVVYRNHVMELIQYSPTTPDVYKEPVLVLPAWIMKYYILDLSPKNSLIRWLIEQGHTVFIVSWLNPVAEDRDLGMDDYYRLGAMAAIDAVSAIIPNTKIHLTGYCLGGTLALIAAAAMAGNKDDRLQSLTLFASQGDFTEAGELRLFVTESQVAFLKKFMWSKGYLDAKQMLGAFQMLRSHDLIWMRIVHNYLLGQRDKMIDLMAWNADATRMPYKMHSEYLEKLFLHNDFAEGRLTIEDSSVAPENITLPIFAVGTEKDHVVPWKSAYKVHIMTSSPVTFVLTNGGHNAGIISEPGHRGRYYRVHERKAGEPYIDPSRWLAHSTLNQSKSWWGEWESWVAARSSSERVKPPQMGTPGGLYQPICDAPGTYVLKK